MAIVVNTNIAAEGIINDLTRSSSRLSRSFEKLSSGLRITRASDDAAGLAVSESLNAETRILNRAQLNVQDGLSLLNIVDSVVSNLSDITVRMAELAEQAINGAISRKQREALDKEYQALDKEIRRISDSTEFNSLSLLEGEKSSNDLKVEVDYSLSATGGTGYSADGRYVSYRRSSDNMIIFLDTTTSVEIEVGQSDGSGKTTMDATGQTLAFTRDNELYIWHKSSGKTQQITNSVTTETFDGFALSADGSTVVFSSATRYSQGGSKDSATSGTGEYLFRVDIETGVYDFVGDSNTSNLGNFVNLEISANGRYATFEHNGDPKGTNGDGNIEVWFIDLDSSASSFTDAVVQVTSTTGSDSFQGEITNDGKVYYQATSDILGLNPGNTANIFEYNSTTGTTRKITSNTDSSNSITSLKASNDGTKLFFTSTLDLTGENSSNVNQFFELDVSSKSIKQKTDFTSSFSGYTNFLIAKDGNSAVAVRLSDTNGFSLDISPDASSVRIDTGAHPSDDITIMVDAINGSLRGLTSMMLTTQASARGALDNVKKSIESLGTLSGTIGAGMNRLLTASKIIATMSEQFSAARSRIVDVDVANESAKLTKEQIRQQAAASILSSANQQPALALRLLNGG